MHFSQIMVNLRFLMVQQIQNFPVIY